MEKFTNYLGELESIKTCRIIGQPLLCFFFYKNQDCLNCVILLQPIEYYEFNEGILSHLLFAVIKNIIVAIGTENINIAIGSKIKVVPNDNKPIIQ